MEIKYLKELEKNPARDGFINKPMSLSEIEQLELTYNNGNPFPMALKELLSLAGHDCIVLDYGLNETQSELQEFVRENMAEENRVISRPFYAVDVYNAFDQFLFIYLDDGDNPPLYEAYYGDNTFGGQVGWIRKMQPNFVNLINLRIQSVKEGLNPF
ncbi:MAG: hypothetical protein EOO87_18800 [Pedobacter sp.]|nr:MAG: hypothetical protein EOO87_18800 [Pedobacter sp.]